MRVCVCTDILFDYYYLPEFLYSSAYAAAVRGVLNFGYFPIQKRMLSTNWIGCLSFKLISQKRNKEEKLRRTVLSTNNEAFLVVVVVVGRHK